MRHVRRYVDADRDACLAIFGSNTPTFFGAHEQPAFAAFLEQHGDRYFVVEDADSIVACGGWGWKADRPRVALLCYGMVHRDHHRRGIGTLLLTHRLREIAKHDFDEVEVNTSQCAAAFFAQAGFVEVAVQTDFYGRGLHGHRMRLPRAEMHPSPEQIARICGVANDSSVRGSGAPLRELLEASDYRRLRATVTETTLSEYLAVHPEVVTQWSMYSDDKRTKGGWYFVDDDHTRTVGRLGPGGARGDERTYNSRFEACAHFILLELDFWANSRGL